MSAQRLRRWSNIVLMLYKCLGATLAQLADASGRIVDLMNENGCLHKTDCCERQSIGDQLVCLPTAGWYNQMFELMTILSAVGENKM